MIKQFGFAILITFIVSSCTESQPEQSVVGFKPPKVVEAKGYVVPAEKMAPPKVVAVLDNIKKTKAGKPKVIKLKTDSSVTVNSRVLLVGSPVIATPGQGGFLPPKVVRAIDSSYMAGLPEIVEVKDFYSPNINPESFSSLSVEQGLLSTTINKIIQDKAGNLWMSIWDGGVSKYDGNSLTHYSMNQGLKSNLIFDILEDKTGNIWISTINGLHKFDGEMLTYYSTLNGLSGNFVSCILEDSKGSLWFGTEDNGINKYDGKTFTHFTTAQGLSSNYVTTIKEDQKGNLWIGTRGGGVSRFDGHSFNNFNSETGFPNNIVNIFANNKGEVWMSALQNGYIKYDGEYFMQYLPLGLKSGLGEIMEDQKGNLWFGSNSGIYIYNRQTFTHIGKEDGLSSNLAWNPFEDQKGNIWIGTVEGLNKYNGNIFKHSFAEQELDDFAVYSILEDENKSLWLAIGTNGIAKYDEMSISWYTKEEGLSANSAACLLKDSNGNIWIGTYDGLNKFDGEAFTTYSESEGLIYPVVISMMEDSKGNLWFGGPLGISIFDGNSFQHITMRQGLCDNEINYMKEDVAGNIWIATNRGVDKYNGKSFTHYGMADGLGSESVKSILEDSYQNIWFGTTNGISKYDGKYITNYTTAQGLSHNVVNSIMEDKEGNLWCGTVNGLNRMRSDAEVKKGTPWFQNFTSSEGFMGVGSSDNAMIQDRDGDIWIGTGSGLTRFMPQEVTPDTITPNIQLTGISLYNEPINWLELEKKKDTSWVLNNGVRVHDLDFSGTSNWYYLPKELKLAYNNNYLSFKYDCITTDRPKEVRYQYFLDGLDKNWSALTKKPEAIYSDLAHGEYTFKVKAMNSEGYWSDELSYTFRIKPPFWYSWWAKIIYGLFFIAGLRMVHLYQKKRVLRIERVKSQKKELAQAREIEKAYTSLKATQTQLIHSEKMASLGELTAGIAHEIQNPLNFVNNFSEVNTELIEELEQEVTAGNIDEIKALAKDIKANEEKITHHGKRADAIVKGMLQHSRSSSGVKEPTDINKLCDEYLRLAYHGLRAKDKTFNATMETEFDKTISTINIIPQDIGRVVLNLLTNAFYAVNDKSKDSIEGQEKDYAPTVTISTKKSKDSVEIKVSDNGNGIPDSVRKKIFQPFFTTKPTGEGTGLGLSMSYDIVTKGHGGKLEVESNKDIGTVFTVSLPSKQKSK